MRRRAQPVDLEDVMPLELQRFDPSQWDPCPDPVGRNDTCPPGAHEQQQWLTARSRWRDEHLPGPEIGTEVWRQRELDEAAEVQRLLGQQLDHWHHGWI